MKPSVKVVAQRRLRNPRGNMTIQMGPELHKELQEFCEAKGITASRLGRNLLEAAMEGQIEILVQEPHRTRKPQEDPR